MGHCKNVREYLGNSDNGCVQELKAYLEVRLTDLNN